MNNFKCYNIKKQLTVLALLCSTLGIQVSLCAFSSVAASLGSMTQGFKTMADAYSTVSSAVAYARVGLQDPCCVGLLGTAAAIVTFGRDKSGDLSVVRGVVTATVLGLGILRLYHINQIDHIRQSLNRLETGLRENTTISKEARDAALKSLEAAQNAETAAKSGEMAAQKAETAAKSGEAAAKNSETAAKKGEEAALKAVEASNNAAAAAKSGETAAQNAEKAAKNSEQVAKDVQNGIKHLQKGVDALNDQSRTQGEKLDQLLTLVRK